MALRKTATSPANNVEERLAALQAAHDELKGQISGKALILDDKVIEAMSKELGPEKFERLIGKLATSASPKLEGFGELVSSTWDGGWKGKTTVIMAGVGVATTVAVLLEGVGAITGADSLRVLKSLSEWYSA